LFFFLMYPRPLRSTLFPYTTLFRSGVELTDFYIMLHPRDRWQRAHTQDELRALIDKELRSIPGQRIAFSQPIEMRMNEMVSGVRSEEHTSELQSLTNLVCRLLLEKK